MTQAAAKPPTTLGKLKSFGLTEPWQVALFLPAGWDDLTRPLRNFADPIFEGDSYVVVGRLQGPPSTTFGQGAPRMTGYLADSQGRTIGFTAFGDTREFKEQLLAEPGEVALLGTIETFKDRLWLKSPELIPSNWLGHFRPRYPGKTGVIGPDLVRTRVLANLRAGIPLAAKFLAQQLKEFGNPGQLAELAGLPGWPLETILLQAHAPKTLALGEQAQRALETLAAFGVIQRAKGNQSLTSTGKPLKLGDWARRACAIPFKLTGEQQQAITDAITDLAAPTPMRRILSGDVGTGKTAVYGTLCAAVVDGKGRAMVLLPNESLATQVAREFSTWWPDLPLQLITGSTSDTDIHAPLVIGTTALLHRKFQLPDLMVVDEQQKFSREQREQLVGRQTNLLEVTATCIPRSQALVRYGVVKVSKLTIPHTPKTIRTRVWFKEQWPSLFAEVQKTMKNGDQVLLVYPLREKAEVEDEENEGGTDGGRPRQPELRSAEEIFEKWSRMLPGRVQWVHGQMSDADKDAALQAMRNDQASILVATTVVEVGINLPKLRRVVVVHPERHGLTTLHQIRGRVARLGGEGYCDLFLPNHVKEKTMARLRVLETTTDGFKVSEWDMRLRGVGDLSQNSTKQSGSDDTFLFGRQVSLDILDAVMEKLAR